MALSQEISGEIAIGELARRSGFQPSAIRYYESIGLLPPPARLAGRRMYDEAALQRLSVIAAGRQAGLALDEIRELLRANDRARVSKRLQQLAREKLPQVEAMIVRAQTVRGWLEAATDCTCPSLDECPLFDVEHTPKNRSS